MLLLAIWRLDRRTDDLVPMAEEALHLAQDAQDVAAQMFALGQLGDLFMEEERGALFFEQAVALGTRANRPVYLASVLNGLSNVLLRRVRSMTLAGS